MTPDDRAALKEVLDEWLERKYATLGKWTLATLGLAAFGAIIYILLTLGWRPSV